MSNWVFKDPTHLLLTQIHSFDTPSFNQSGEYRFGIRFGLAIGMEYFGTGQYRCSVLGLPQIYM